jgi:rod shape-determining protein MreC
MKRGFFLQFGLAVVLLVILYELWPLPFEVFSKRAILPASYKITQAARYIASPFVIVANINKLADTNKRLEQENLSLKSDNAKSLESAHVCEILNKEVGQSSQNRFDVVAALVVGRTPSLANQVLIVDKGSNDGVKNGAAVMSQGYLVGVTMSVTASQSEVRLITGHDSFIPAVTLNSRESGLVQGGLEGLDLTEVPISSPIGQGETVLTSGLGGDLPAGIIIGTLGSQVSKTSGLFQTIQIDYPVHINSLEVVSIIK